MSNDPLIVQTIPWSRKLSVVTGAPIICTGGVTVEASRLALIVRDDVLLAVPAGAMAVSRGTFFPNSAPVTLRFALARSKTSS